ncbi:MAG: hypothetical protein ACREUR_01880 [Nitrosospira sp.]
MDLLLAWEQGLDQTPTRQALALLSACSPGITQDTLAALPIGARDTHLLRLRESLFGNAVAAVSECPKCGERLEVAFNIDDVCDSRVCEMNEEPMKAGLRTYRFCKDGYDITYRNPTSADLLVLSENTANIPSHQMLLQRCVTDVQQNGIPMGAGNQPLNSLPDSVIAAISKNMADADPQAHIELVLTCPECDHAWNALFDIAAFLWSEVHVWASRILNDVHMLARAYGWREADILAMSARRRQTYLELARS